MIKYKGVLSDNHDNQRYWLSVREVPHDKPDIARFLLHVRDKKSKVAFTSFDISDSGLSFVGMRVSPAYRQRNIASTCIEHMVSFAHQNNVPLDYTKIQRKPDICYLLNMFGFKPAHGHEPQDVVISRGQEDAFGLWFPKETNRKKFEQTGAYQQGEYSFLDRKPTDVPHIWIKIGVNYVLADLKTLEQKIERNHKKYSFAQV